jgi:beta-galactosidase beta subunit
LKETDLLPLTPGSAIPIDGDTVFLQVQEYITGDPAELLFETHNIYDMHYVVKEREYIEYLPRRLLSNAGTYDPVQDRRRRGDRHQNSSKDTGVNSPVCG